MEARLIVKLWNLSVSGTTAYWSSAAILMEVVLMSLKEVIRVVLIGLVERSAVLMNIDCLQYVWDWEGSRSQVAEVDFKKTKGGMGFESILAAGKARTEAIPPMTKARVFDDVKPIAGGGGREWTVSCFHPGLDSSFMTTALLLVNVSPTAKFSS
jgi:hypothetical protein